MDRNEDVRAGELFAELVGAADQRCEKAYTVYQLLRSTRRLRSHRILSYRCPRRCLLLDVLVVPDGVIVAQPRYKLSPGVNLESSNESGRRANTEDGDRRWKGRAFYVQDAANFSLNCDHVRNVVLEKHVVQAALDAGEIEMTVNPGASNDC